MGFKYQTKYQTNDGREALATCHARYVRCAPRKIRIVADMIRGKTAREAIEILSFTHRPSAVPHLMKALKSALANARDAAPEPLDLTIGEIIVDEAPMFKRIRPAAMGRAVRIRKRRSHIRIALTEA